MKKSLFISSVSLMSLLMAPHTYGMPPKGFFHPGDPNSANRALQNRVLQQDPPPPPQHNGQPQHVQQDAEEPQQPRLSGFTGAAATAAVAVAPMAVHAMALMSNGLPPIQVLPFVNPGLGYGTLALAAVASTFFANSRSTTNGGGGPTVPPNSAANPNSQPNANPLPIPAAGPNPARTLFPDNNDDDDGGNNGGGEEHGFPQNEEVDGNNGGGEEHGFPQNEEVDGNNGDGEEHGFPQNNVGEAQRDPSEEVVRRRPYGRGQQSGARRGRESEAKRGREEEDALAERQRQRRADDGALLYQADRMLGELNGLRRTVGQNLRRAEEQGRRRATRQQQLLLNSIEERIENFQHLQEDIRSGTERQRSSARGRLLSVTVDATHFIGQFTKPTARR